MSSRPPLVRVTRQAQCPICGKPNWCSVSADSALAICMRISEGSLRATRNNGYLHRLRECDPLASRPARRVELPATPRDLTDDFMPRLRAAWRRPADLDWHARALGVTRGSLEALLASGEGDLLHAPMFDHERRIVGVRVRRLDGAKWAWPGGREGVFWPMPGADGPLLLPEGPTSSAALLDLGFAVLGRPCAKPGALAMGALRELVRGRHVVVLGENDAKPDGRHPGREGAEYCARALLLDARAVRLAFPPSAFKDARDWIRAGATRSDVERLVASTEPLMLTVEVRR